MCPLCPGPLSPGNRIRARARLAGKGPHDVISYVRWIVIAACLNALYKHTGHHHPKTKLPTQARLILCRGPKSSHRFDGSGPARHPSSIFRRQLVDKFGPRALHLRALSRARWFQKKHDSLPHAPKSPAQSVEFVDSETVGRHHVSGGSWPASLHAASELAIDAAIPGAAAGSGIAWRAGCFEDQRDRNDVMALAAHHRPTPHHERRRRGCEAPA
jgi:hypothetical protein